MINKYLDKIPDVKKASFIAWNADISGDVSLGEKTSIWFSATLRGDIAPIKIGNFSNIQDGTVCHVGTNIPLIIGDWVTVGHNAILHSCTIENNCLIGMGAIVMDNSLISHHSIVGAGTLVTGNKSFPPYSMIMGSPAKAVRTLTEKEISAITENAKRYLVHAEETILSRQE
ncbi:MAG: gamma carbonic anhydrase family protein [Spirochaetales bacterium]|nr:gamma carbonic anhydrase family protein [Spirochaetales bacterium]